MKEFFVWLIILESKFSYLRPYPIYAFKKLSILQQQIALCLWL
jgi:hypothetical protein